MFMRACVKSIKAYLYLLANKLNLHRDLAFNKRWLYKKYFLKGNIRTLDVGGGGGPFTIQCLKNGNIVTLIDLNRLNIDRAIKKIKMMGFCDYSKIEAIACDVRKYETENKFDQIILFEVLEHIKDDQEVLDKLSFLLRPGGQPLFSSPSDNYPMFYGEKISLIEDGGHIRKGYSFDDIERKIASAGLKVILKESYIGYFTQKSLALTRYISDKLASSILIMIPLKLVLLPFTYLDKFASQYPNYSIFIIAKKE
ncbi:MAG: tRNA 5-carboxymethoxyuridine methyltransferase [candidate division WS2 bacterium]|nr:tRNA 5-carboxymethoxyuridine methyltransferase [Candidatus Lithacetigena glycinireducens]